MPAARIITVTLSAAIDRVVEARGLAPGAHVSMREIARLPAGKGFNVARGIALLGGRCVAAGLVGKRDGAWFGTCLRQQTARRVEPLLVLIPERTRRCLTLRDPAMNDEYHLRSEAPTLNSADAERLISRVLPRARRGTHVALCGAAPSGAGVACLLTLLSECRRRGAIITLDTSGPALEAARNDELSLLKINADELGALTGRRTNTRRQVIAAAEPLIGRGPRARAIIITRGRDGAVLLSSRGAMEARVGVPKRLVRGTVGCGDAFLAGVLFERSRGSGWAPAMRRGVAAATALAVSETPGMFTPESAALFFRSATAETI